MPINPGSLLNNQTTGTVEVAASAFTIDLDTNIIPFIGNQTFNMVIRRTDQNGRVIYKSPSITLIDTTSVTQIVPNVTILNEGAKVDFGILTANVAYFQGYYTTNSQTGNVNLSDFLESNTGTVTIINDSANIVLTANADLSIMENEEYFSIDIRKDSITGPIIASSGNVLLRDNSNIVATTAIFGNIDINHTFLWGQEVIFNVYSNVSSSATLYYETVGPTNSSTFLDANTGTISATGDNTTNISLTSNSNVLLNGLELFLRVRKGSANGPIVADSSNIRLVDPAGYYLIATGGNVFYGGNYKYHVFTTSSDLSIPQISPASPRNNLEYLLVAGGGGAGAKRGGGGGAGGIVNTLINLDLPGPYTIPIQVGAGGAGGVGAQVTGGASGTNSNIQILGSLYSANGGGFGFFEGAGGPGGSGGGSSINDSRGGGAGGTGIPGQGNPGGQATQNQSGGGGGGSGQAGFGPPTASIGGRGGNGTATYNVWLANVSAGVLEFNGLRYIAGGGGGGGGTSGGGTLQFGGLGGGGNAGPGSGQAGNVNTGSGGGGAWDNPGYTGGQGGSGIVIVRYPWYIQ